MNESYSNAIVTGASSGLGREFALQIAPRCAHLCLVGRNLTELEKTANEARRLHPQIVVECRTVDFTVPTDLDRFCTQIRGQSFDLYILNAGGGLFKPFLEFDAREIRREIDLNLTGHLMTLESTLKASLKQARESGKRVQLLWIASHAAFMPVPRFAVYSSAKSFLGHAIRTLRSELSGEPIHIAAAFPGAMATQFSGRAGIPLMLSQPQQPAQIARHCLALMPRRRRIFTSPMDRIYYYMFHFLPEPLFDWLLRSAQNRYLKGRQA